MMFDEYKVNGKNRDVIKKALTEGKNNEELVIFSSNLDRHSKLATGTKAISKTRAAFPKTQSMQSSILSKNTSISAKKSPGQKQQQGSNKEITSPLRPHSVMDRTTDSLVQKKGSRERKTEVKIESKKNLQLPSEYLMSTFMLFGRPNPGIVGNQLKSTLTHQKSSIEKGDSSSFKQFSSKKITKNPRAVTSYASLFKHSRFHTPNLACKSQLSDVSEKVGERTAHPPNSGRKKKVDPKYRSFFNAFSKQKSSVEGKLPEEKVSTVGSIKSSSNQFQEERKSFTSKNSNNEHAPPKRQPLHNEALQKDLLEMNQLIGRLKHMTENRTMNKEIDSPFLQRDSQRKLKFQAPQNSARAKKPVMPSTDFVLEQMYKDLIKKTNTLYKEIYAD
jgi:hypothetical protein